MSKMVLQNVIRVLYVVVLSAFALYLISPFLAPIAFGGTVALAMYPLLKRLEGKGLKRKRASLVLTGGFALLVSIPFFFFIVKGTLAVSTQLQKFSTEERFRDKGMNSIIMTLKHDVVLNLQKYGGKFGIKPFLSEEKIDKYLAHANGFLLDFFQSVATNLPEVFLFFLVMVICTYSFLQGAAEVHRTCQKLTGFSDERMGQLVKIFINDSRSVYVSNIATGGMQSLIVATAVGLLGAGDFFLTFFVTLILSFIPVVGAAPVAFVFALIAFVQDESTQAIILLGVGAFTGVADNILRPFLASLGESKIPPVPAFVFVVGGALLLGFPGLFIGLLVGSFAYDTLPLFWDELSQERGEDKVMYVKTPHHEAPTPPPQH